jgi:adhesin transport system membrane fusion protein
VSTILKPSYGIIISIGVLIIGFIIWSQWAELDEVTRATGKVIPFDRVQVVQSENGGAISQIKVREGEVVRAGQLLVELDKIQLNAAVGEIVGKVAALESRMARINAELFNRPLNFPEILAEFPRFVENQRRLFERRRAALVGELTTLEELAELQEQELEMNLPLMETGDVSLAEIIRMRRLIVETKGEISTIESQYVRDLQAEFTDTEEDLVAARQQLARAEDNLRAASLLAPTNGIVKNLQFTTIGGIVDAGDEVLQIVPVDEELIIEAKVPPSEIAFVNLGQIARINFDTYDSAVYGSGLGSVVFISPDTLTEVTPDGSAETYYRVHLKVDISGMNPVGRGEEIFLQPGMTAIAEILTGGSTVWDYLTKPILKTISSSMTER